MPPHASHFHFSSLRRKTVISLATPQYIMYFVALGLRVRSIQNGHISSLVIAKAVYSVNLMHLFLRTLRLYAVSKSLGPKLIVVFKMLDNFLTFIAFYSIVMGGYGIALQSLLFPFAPADSVSLSSIVYRPFFQLFGDLMLETIDIESHCIGAFPFSSCGYTYWVSLVLMSFYLIVSNIMLINLLIAMLSSTYEEVARSSLQLWRFQFYELLDEYRNRAIMPGPFSAIENIIVLVTYVRTTWWFRKMSKVLCKTSSHPTSVPQEDGAVDTLEQFQEKHTEAYLDLQAHQQALHLESRIQTIGEAVHRLQDTRALLDELLRRSDAAAIAPRQGTNTPEPLGFYLTEASRVNEKSRTYQGYPYWERVGIKMPPESELTSESMPLADAYGSVVEVFYEKKGEGHPRWALYEKECKMLGDALHVAHLPDVLIREREGERDCVV